MPKRLDVAIRQVGAHFRVVYQRQYPKTVEDVVYSERFKTQEEAQKFWMTSLRAQRIYRNLSPRSTLPIVKTHAIRGIVANERQTLVCLAPHWASR